MRLTETKKDGIVSGTWAYDADGNRTTVNGAIAKYDGQDRLTSVGGVTYAYDAWGNRRWKMEGPSSTEYRYQGPGELKQVVLPNGTSIEYVIDYRGRRVGKLKNGAFQVGWVYDGQLRIIGEVDAKGATTSRFVSGTLGHSPDVMVRGGVTYRYVHDALGSVRLVVNVQTGQVAQRMDYDPWGVLEKDTSPGFQPFGYVGGLYDADTGLVRFGARDYDATTGTWLSPEPLSQSPSYVASTAQRGMGVPTYAYAANNPLRYADPTGLWYVPALPPLPWWVPVLPVLPYLGAFGGGFAIGFGVGYLAPPMFPSNHDIPGPDRSVAPKRGPNGPAGDPRCKGTKTTADLKECWENASEAYYDCVTGTMNAGVSRVDCMAAALDVFEECSGFRPSDEELRNRLGF